ncbi:hypothetical protein BGZ58_002503 [Dissophora ornata]|nr:hypothetical protein BGZ58_002503 [Dissophora ornata]
MKRKRLDEEAATSCSCSSVLTPGLEYVLSVSPYKALLGRRKFVELDADLCELFNQDWEFSPHIRYACARALAGCIFFNTKRHQAVIANTVEVYGRTKMVDIHRESFVVQKGQPLETSLPPSMKTPYLNVWPKTLSSREGVKQLLLGTRSFNALVTSSLRLDTKRKASIGASTLSFLLSSIQDSLATKIYLDVESVRAALSLADDVDACDFAASHPHQPYTVFSLASFDQAHNGDGVAASKIFRIVANMVIKIGTAAMLTKQAVVESRGRCVDLGKVAKVLDNILSLYPEDQLSIPVIGNKVLNKHLEALALLLASYIASANKSVTSFIDQEFISS